MSIRYGLTAPVAAKALIFDMDGTLLLSHAVVDRVWRGWAAKHGLDADQLIHAAHGRRMLDTVRDFCPPGLSPVEEADRLAKQEREDVEGIVAVAGVQALLASLPPDRWAIVTSADRQLAAVRLAAAGIAPPAVMVTCEDVRLGKPDPEGYLLAAKRLGVEPHDTIVFEDAPAGIAAARAAGAKVVILATAPTDYAGYVEDKLEDFQAVRATAADGRIVVSRRS